jgi:oxygen-independent coproporphyrinogen-3 oxidase
MLGLYLHVPFCASICAYCNFNRGLMDAALKRRYLAAFEREIRSAAREGDAPADTIFFGGGTPSLLEPAEIADLLRACRETWTVAPDAEITLETNPETATPARLDAFRAAGVNRISFGVQSFDDAELARLGRTHSAARAAEAVREARRVGFDNLSFDLMFWLPGQTSESWRRTIDAAIDLAPDHLSLYLLELYPNAPLKESLGRLRAAGASAAAEASADRSARQAWLQASDDEAADMYLGALDRLDGAGFEHYEISNVARPGYRSRHNVKYWQGGEWVGLGCGAHSTARGRRWKNISGTADYCERIETGRPVTLDVHELGANERVEEALFTGLRMTDGIDGRNFAIRYGVDPWSRYGASLDPYVTGGFVWRRDAAFGLTRKGMLVANEILATFV